MKLRLEELETSQAAIAEEQSRWQTDRVQQLETERTDLKDKNDELTIQVEELRQQLASATRRKSRGTRPRDASPAPGRTGSVLSDYQRPVLVRRSSDTVSSEEEEGSLTGSGRIRRRLPQPPSNLTLAEEESLRAEIETLKKEKEELGRVFFYFFFYFKKKLRSQGPGLPVTYNGYTVFLAVLYRSIENL